VVKRRRELISHPESVFVQFASTKSLCTHKGSVPLNTRQSRVHQRSSGLGVRFAMRIARIVPKGDCLRLHLLGGRLCDGIVVYVHVLREQRRAHPHPTASSRRTPRMTLSGGLPALEARENVCVNPGQSERLRWLSTGALRDS
jgi:hypothetical protein